MAHGITETDRVVSVRSKGWHGLAKEYKDYPSTDEVMQDVFNWEPVVETLYRSTPIINPDGELSQEYSPVEEAKLWVRSDNGDVLGVPPSTREPVSNREMMEVAEALEKESRNGVPLKVETAGTLRGGRHTWLLIRLEEPLRIPGDPKGDSIPYFALQNSHAEVGAFKGSATVVRIICENTVKLSDMDSRMRGTDFSFRHTSNIAERIELAKLSLAGWREGIREWEEMATHLSRIKVTDEQRREFIEAFIPMPNVNTISDRVRNNILKDREAMRELYNGPTLDYIELSAYGLVQGAVEFAQHVRGTKGRTERDRMENRFKRAYLDDSQLTQNAMRIMKDIVPV